MNQSKKKLTNVVDAKELDLLSNKLRIKILDVINEAKGGHIGGCFSVIDLMVNIYSNFLKFDSSDPKWSERDYLILSKGHCCVALYVILNHFKFFDNNVLKKYSVNGGIVGGHPKKDDAPGIEATTGSLGHGLGIGNGIALGSKINQKNNKVFVVMSDGEMNEGSVWESVLFAAQQKLDNLFVILDNNNQISLDSLDNILSIEPIDEKFRKFGWNVERINGHDHNDINKSLNSLIQNKEKRPSALIADTVKGKGVSFMEGVTKWHYRGPSEEEYKYALEELRKNL